MRRRHETRFILILIGLLSAVALVGSFSVIAIDSAGGLTAGSFTIYPTTTKPNLAPTHGSAEVGTKFTVDATGSVVALRYYRGMSSTSARTATLWSANGQALAQATFSSHGTGWQTAYLSRHVSLRAGATYVVGFHADQGAYYQQPDKLAKGHTIGNQYIHAVAGMVHRGGAAFPSTPTSSAFFADVVFVPTSGVTSSSPSSSAPTSPTSSTSSTSASPTQSTSSTTAGGGASSPPKASSPTKSASSGSGSSSTTTGSDISGGFPNASTTGVPAGTALSTYTGPLTITKCGVVISNVTINGSLQVAVGNGTHSASTPCVTINNSTINGVVGTGSSTGSDGPLVLNHVEVSAPTTSNVQAVALSNFYLDSVNVHGGANGGVECYGYCSISNSWIHDFYNAGSTHYDGIISNGNSGLPLVIDHNSIGCNFYASAPGANGGCSADLGLFGDFGTISNVTVTNNLFLAGPSAYCMYGGNVAGKAYPNPSNVVATGNTFQRGANGKCGIYGAIIDWAPGSGDAWSNNVWDDGAVLSS
jgi:hypothetical protein